MTPDEGLCPWTPMELCPRPRSRLVLTMYTAALPTIKYYFHPTVVNKEKSQIGVHK